MATGGRSFGSPHFKKGSHRTRHSNNLLYVNSLHANDITIAGKNVVILNVNPFSPRFKPPDGIYDEALRPPPPKEDLKPQFRPEDLERDCDEKMFTLVSRAFETTNQCSWLARKLKIDGPTMSKIMMWHRNDIPELTYQVMVAWKRISRKAKVKTLVTALCETRNHPQCRKLIEYFEQERREQEESRENEQ